jgi:hypothetical protein
MPARPPATPPVAPVEMPPRTPLRTVVLALGMPAVSVVAVALAALVLLLAGQGLDAGTTAGTAALWLVVAIALAVATWAVGAVWLVRRLFPAGARADTGLMVAAVGAGATMLALFAPGAGLPSAVVVVLLVLPQVLMAGVMLARDAGLRRTGIVRR